MCFLLKVKKINMEIDNYMFFKMSLEGRKKRIDAEGIIPDNIYPFWTIYDLIYYNNLIFLSQ